MFYFTHFFYFAFWVVCVLHCTNFWKFFMLPAIIFFTGKLIMVYKWLEGRGATHVVSGTLLPSKVTQLTIRRSPDFHFNPGDWVFVNLPTISRFEWHPFTLS